MRKYSSGKWYLYFPMMIILLIFMGCNRDRRLPIYRWTPSGNEYDSVLLKMERDFDEFAPPSVLLDNLAQMDSLTRIIEGDSARVRRGRTLFWKSRYAARYISKDSAYNLIVAAMSITDSAYFPYDWLRLKSQLYSTSNNINAAEKYRHYIETLKFARAVGDKHLEANMAVDLGNLMLELREPEKAAYYITLSDSLFAPLNLTKLIIKNRINRAFLLQELGLQQSADSMLRSLEGHPALEGDTFTQNLIPRNLYGNHRQDTAQLLRAYAHIKDNQRFRNLRGLYRALLTEHYAKTQQWDSMEYYGDRMMEDLPYVKNQGHRALIWLNRANVFYWKSQLDSALSARINYEESLDSLRNYERANEVLRLDALEEMRRQEVRYALLITRRNWAIAFVTMLLIGIGSVTVLLLNRRHMRQRMRSMANELELEKAKRKMAATAITIEEKDVMLDSLRSELSEMRKEGEIKEGSARRLEASIKTHLSGHEQEETFRDMFDTVNPGFTHRLRDICPDLADSYVRLACYTLMELDNKRIASLMNIRPESVRQSRWRLRKRLNIPEETSLEDFLRNLNNAR